MVRFKITVFTFDSKAQKEVLYERNMEVSSDFSSSLIVDHYIKVMKTLYPTAAGVEFLFM